MLRQKLYDAQRSQIAIMIAAEDMKTGSAVQIDYATNTFAFPAAETADNLFFPQKNASPRGVNAARIIASDWDDGQQNVKEGEPAVLFNYLPGEMFATDQADSALFDSPPANGTALAAGADGKLKAAAVPSRYVFMGIEAELGNKLALVSVLDAPIA